MCLIVGVIAQGDSHWLSCPLLTIQCFIEIGQAKLIIKSLT
jgi:hypothetical protein